MSGCGLGWFMCGVGLDKEWSLVGLLLLINFRLFIMITCSYPP